MGQCQGEPRGTAQCSPDAATCPRVDAWRLPLDLPPPRADSPALCLSAWEEDRLARVASPMRRARMLAAWVARREILARFLACSPRDVPLVQDEGRAPKLEGTSEHLWFSLSHSDAWMLFAASRSVAVGVDIQRVDCDADVVRLAARFFSPEEARALARLAVSERPGAFFRAWTQKEAILKGVGGSVPSCLRTVPVPIAPLGHAPASFPHAHWTLHALPAPVGYEAALATSGDALLTLHDRISGAR